MNENEICGPVFVFSMLFGDVTKWGVVQTSVWEMVRARKILEAFP